MATPVLVADQVTTVHRTLSPAATGTVSFSHDSGTQGGNRATVIRISGINIGTIGTVTYNGVSCTLPTGGSRVVGTRQVRTVVLAAPATGSNTVAIPLSGGSGSGTLLVQVSTYQDVDQTNPFAAFADAQTFGNPTVDIASTATTDLVLDNCFNYSDATGTAGANQTEESDQNSGGASSVGSQFTSREAGTGGTVTMSWTPSAQNNYLTQAGRLQYSAAAADPEGSAAGSSSATAAAALLGGAVSAGVATAAAVAVLLGAAVASSAGDSSAAAQVHAAAAATGAGTATAEADTTEPAGAAAGSGGASAAATLLAASAAVGSGDASAAVQVLAGAAASGAGDALGAAVLNGSAAAGGAGAISGAAQLLGAGSAVGAGSATATDVAAAEPNPDPPRAWLLPVRAKATLLTPPATARLIVPDARAAIDS